jgi:hypothetical protein
VNYRQMQLVLMLLIVAAVVTACLGGGNPVEPTSVSATATVAAGASSPAATVSGGQSLPAASSPAATQASGQSLPPASSCQARLWGKIADANGKAVIKETVLLHGSKEAKTFTDPSGFYGFAGLCAGDYSLSVSLQDGSSREFPDKMSLEGSQDLRKDLTLN